MGKVVLVLADEFVRGALAAALEGHGHVVAAFGDEIAIDRVVDAQHPDVVILELHDGDNEPEGLAIGRRLRAVSTVPLMYLARCEAVEDRMAGFGVGADDVMSQPFSVVELFARVNALMRRGAGTARHVLEVDDLVVDELAHTVRCRDAEIELTSLEFSLLTTLLRHQNQVLSKVQLLDEVWGFEHYDVNLVEVHVSALRRKLEAHIPRIIHTVRGAGYVVRAAARRPVLVPTGT